MEKVLSGTTADVEKKQAAGAVEDRSRDNDKESVNLPDAGVIENLISMLSSRSVEIQEQAARDLWSLADHDEIRALISDAGAIQPLVCLLESAKSSVAVQQAAARALASLSTAANQFKISDAGAFGPFITLLSSKAVGVQEQAAGLSRTWL